MKLLGVLLGALLAPALLVGMVILVYPRIESSGNWDWVTPYLTLITAAVACVVGGAAGWLVVEALQAGDTRRAGIVVLVCVGLISLFPAWLAWTLYGPQPKLEPARPTQRERWAGDLKAFNQQQGFSEVPGLTVAWGIRTCLRSGCAPEQWRWYGHGEEGVAADTRSYRPGDDGWRWETVEGHPRRTVVFPDPRLGRDGPVFEVDAWDIFRRENRAAPAFSTDSMLAALFAMQECVTRFAAEARTSGVWDGQGDTLGAAIADHWSAPGGCPGIRVYQRPERGYQPWEFEILSGPATHARFQIQSDRTTPDIPWRYRFMHDGRGFTRDPGGGWHMRPGNLPSDNDPAPPPCLIDPGVPCRTDRLPPPGGRTPG